MCVQNHGSPNDGHGHIKNFQKSEKFRNLNRNPQPVDSAIRLAGPGMGGLLSTQTGERQLPQRSVATVTDTGSA